MMNAFFKKSLQWDANTLWLYESVSQNESHGQGSLHLTGIDASQVQIKYELYVNERKYTAGTKEGKSVLNCLLLLLLF